MAEGMNVDAPSQEETAGQQAEEEAQVVEWSYDKKHNICAFLSEESSAG